MSRVEIALAICGDGFEAMLENEEDCLVVHGGLGAAATCLATAKKLRALADRFEALSRESQPCLETVQRKINKNRRSKVEPVNAPTSPASGMTDAAMAEQAPVEGTAMTDLRTAYIEARLATEHAWQAERMALLAWTTERHSQTSVPTCADCGTTKDAKFGLDPFSDGFGQVDMVCLCTACHSERIDQL